MASRALRTRPSLHPGLCSRCHGAGTAARADSGWVYCAACHGHGILP